MKYRYPRNWGNEKEIAALFFPLPPKDSDDYDWTLRFWRIALRSYAVQNSESEPGGINRRVSFTRRMLKTHFYHSKVGRPKCIAEILRLFEDEKAIQCKSHYFGSNKFSVLFGWVLNFFKKPSLGSEEIYFYEDILEKKAEKFNDRQLAKIKKHTDHIVINFEDTRKGEKLLHGEDKELILLFLERCGKIARQKFKNKFMFYKIITNDTESKISELDHHIAIVKFTKKTLKMQRKNLIAEIFKKEKLARNLALVNQRNAALAVLRIKRRMQTLLDSRVNSLNNIDIVLLEINSLHVSILTADGLKEGSELLKRLSSSLDVSSIDDCLFDVSSLLEETGQASDALASDLNPSAAAEDEALLSELGDFMAEINGKNSLFDPQNPVEIPLKNEQKSETSKKISQNSAKKEKAEIVGDKRFRVKKRRLKGESKNGKWPTKKSVEEDSAPDFR